LAWRAQNLDAYGLSNDEGVYLMWGRLAADGYPLYSQTYAVQPPLFLEWVGWAFRLAGPTIAVGRWAILPSFGLLAVALSWLAYRSGRWPAAIATMLLLGLAPLVFTFSRLVMAEIPATALAVLTIALAFRFVDTGSKGWLLASGLALGLSFLLKALNPFVLVPVFLLIEVRRRIINAAYPSLILWLLWWGVGLSLPLAAVPLWYDPAAVYDQLIRFRGDLRQAIPGSTTETWQLFTAFISSHWGFWLLAFGGIMAKVWPIGLKIKSNKKEPFPPSSPAPDRGFSLHPFAWLAWLIAGVLMLWWHTPLFPHHFVILLPPLILLGAEGITVGLEGWRDGGLEGWQVGRLDKQSSILPTFQRGPIIIALALVIIATLNLPALIQANNQTAAIVTGGREAEALKLLQTVSQPHDFVMGDSQLLIFMANRRTPPPLGDVALVAIKAGRQTSARMIALTQEYQAPAVVQWSLRLPWLPDYLDWVQANYLARRVWDNDHLIYFGLRRPADQPLPNARTVRLGDTLALRGYALAPGPVKAGADLNVTLYWQADSVPERDYTVFTQLLDKTGARVAGWDSQPLGGYLPTSQWPAGEIITDIVHLPIPSQTLPGDYTLMTGMYLLETQERLRTAEGGDFINLTHVRIE
jgi:hypothetical protein